MLLSESEIREGKLSASNELEAVRRVRVTGYVIFESVIPLDKIERLRTVHQQQLDEHMNGPNPNGTGPRRYNMYIRVDPPYADPEILAHPLVMTVVRKLLGDDAVCDFFASDTALDGSQYQLVHMDDGNLFPELPGLSLPPTVLVLDIPLVDFREDNGPLEIWPGTHHTPYLDIGEVVGTEEELAGGRRPVPEAQAFAESLGAQPVLMPAGSLLIRDARLWHRGSPNRCGEPRPMLALMYLRPWLRGAAQLRILRSVYEGLPPDLRALLRPGTIEEDSDPTSEPTARARRGRRWWSPPR